MNKAFVLGAGFGTRLQPLTDRLPKPLVPVANKPLITYAFDLLRSAGVNEFVVNSHHLADAYEVAFPDHRYADSPIQLLREEPVILDTGGGLANAASLLQDEDFWVYNGDILMDLPLELAMEAHRSSGNLATLILRSGGPNRNVAFDPSTGQIKDLRNALNTDSEEVYQFTGVYLVNPRFLTLLKPEPQSVVPAFLQAIQDEQLGGVVIDEGYWWDLGNREAYMEANFVSVHHDFPAFPTHQVPVRVHPDSRINQSAVIDSHSVVGSGCVVGAGVVLNRSILWPGARIAAGAKLERCVVTGRKNPVLGDHVSEDL